MPVFGGGKCAGGCCTHCVYSWYCLQFVVNLLYSLSVITGKLTREVLFEMVHFLIYHLNFHV